MLCTCLPTALQHMGVASLACMSGCTCKPSRLDATTPHLLSLFMPFVFEVRAQPWGSAAGALCCLPAVCTACLSAAQHALSPSTRLSQARTGGLLAYPTHLPVPTRR